VLASDADLIRFITEALAKDDDTSKRLRLAIEQIVPMLLPPKDRTGSPGLFGR
jgi:hypothetical protein